MVRFSRINMSLFVILVLQFTAVTGQNSPSFTVKVGDEVTLPCGNVINNQDKCDGTSWLVSRYTGATATALVTHGKISSNEISKAKSERLSVTAECSLVIKNITVKDVGRYTCRQFRSGQQQAHAPVHLAVISLKHFQNNQVVSLYCIVFTFGLCGHTVEWWYQGDKNDTENSQSPCSAVVVLTTRLSQNSNYSEILKCNVTDNKSGQMLLCKVSPQSPYEKTVLTTKSEGITIKGRNKTTPAKDETTMKEVAGWWRYIIVSVVLAALSISVVVVQIWTKTKGNKTQMDENVAAPEDGVSKLHPDDQLKGPGLR